MKVITFVFVGLLVVSCVDSAWDPYQTLGLRRGASAQDIRKAYKQYAKEWFVYYNSYLVILA